MRRHNRNAKRTFNAVSICQRITQRQIGRLIAACLEKDDIRHKLTINRSEKTFCHKAIPGDTPGKPAAHFITGALILLLFHQSARFCQRNFRFINTDYGKAIDLCPYQLIDIGRHAADTFIVLIAIL